VAYFLFLFCLAMGSSQSQLGSFSHLLVAIPCSHHDRHKNYEWRLLAAISSRRSYPARVGGFARIQERQEPLKLYSVSDSPFLIYDLLFHLPRGFHVALPLIALVIKYLIRWLPLWHACRVGQPFTPFPLASISFPKLPNISHHYNPHRSFCFIFIRFMLLLLSI
jgi:hypothetical protein